MKRRYKITLFLLVCMILGGLWFIAHTFSNLSMIQEEWKGYIKEGKHELVLSEAESIASRYDIRLLLWLNLSFTKNDLVFLRFLEGETARNLKDFARVEEALNKAIMRLQDRGKLTRDPNKLVLAGLADYNLGISYTEQEDLGRALEAFIESVKLNPHNPKAKVMLEMLRMAQRQRQPKDGGKSGLDSRDTRRRLPWDDNKDQNKEMQEGEILR